MSNRGRTSGEDGAALPLLAIILVVLLGFGALAIDLGYGWAERRTAQLTADAAVLAAAVEFQTPGADPQASVLQALNYTDLNLDRAIPNADWVACNDADALAITAADLGLLPATQCISFSAAGDEVRVKVPAYDIETFFAQVMGFDTIAISAAANASIIIPTLSSGPPFVVTDGTSAGDQVCLRSSSSGPAMPGQWVGNGPGPSPGPSDATQPLTSEPGYVADPCDEFDAASQFFGTLLPFTYEDPNPAPPDQSCQQTSTIDYAIAEGIDHNLSSWEPDYPAQAATQTRLEGDGCPSGPPQLWPNTMDLQTGFTASVLRCGLISTSGGVCANGPQFDGEQYEPRFWQGGYFSTSGAEFAGEDMENVPLWNFFRANVASVADVPVRCGAVYSNRTNPDWDYFDKKEALTDCLSQWTPNAAGSNWLFTEDLIKTARFAFIPMLDEASLATSPVHFNSFVPAWLQKIYQTGNLAGSPDPMCFSQAEGTTGSTGWYWHEAGQPFNCGRSNQNIDRVAAVVLDCAMLPASTCTADINPSNPGGTPVYQILLTR
jgi:hypothetical protein